ncbi:MAG: hydrogenase maturation protease [bacterium]|nr:hydrogenase maturation protease [bacterium]MDI1336736.1 hydrogenase maturation protease [Lacunisphaera sp.]
MQLLDSTLVGEVSAICPEATGRERVLVLGVGNLLMGDEGVGIHVLRTLEQQEPVPGARLLDGGTGGINLLREFDGAADIIMIDATRDGRPAGTITFLQPLCVGELPRGLGAHDFGLKDLFAAAALLGHCPRIHLFTVSVQEVRPMCTELAPAVAEAVPEVVHTVMALAARLVARG